MELFHSTRASKHLGKSFSKREGNTHGNNPECNTWGAEKMEIAVGGRAQRGKLFPNKRVTRVDEKRASEPDRTLDLLLEFLVRDRLRR